MLIKSTCQHKMIWYAEHKGLNIFFNINGVLVECKFQPIEIHTITNKANRNKEGVLKLYQAVVINSNLQCIKI